MGFCRKKFLKVKIVEKLLEIVDVTKKVEMDMIEHNVVDTIISDFVSKNVCTNYSVGAFFFFWLHLYEHLNIK